MTRINNKNTRWS